MTETSHHETIARRAYQLWESEGRPDGLEKDHWSRAEAEVGPDASEAREQGVPSGANAAAATMPAEPQASEAMPSPATPRPRAKRTAMEPKKSRF